VAGERSATREAVLRLNYDHHERMAEAREKSRWRQLFIDARDRRLMRRMLKGAPPNGPVLEVGCSHFRFGPDLKERFGEVAGVDLHAPSVERAKARGFDARVCLAEDLDKEFRPATFNVILSRHVLEHTAEPDTVLRHVRALLRPGGVTAHAVPIPPYEAAGLKVVRAERVAAWGKAENHIVATRPS
jgi:2-polyprenyl-3-methyl-5-hydroxy-6-metoxy-1,4-benzoquinol methylase